MKALFFIAALLLCVSSFGQKAESNDETLNVLTATGTISGSQILAADSVILIPSPGTGRKLKIHTINLELLTGTNYAGAGTDSTFIIDKANKLRNKLFYIKDAFFTTNNPKPVDISPEIMSIDYDSALWFKSATQFSSGTRPLKWIIEYEIF